MQHIRRHHHTDEGVRAMLNEKYCGKRECNRLIGMNQVSCVDHRNVCMERQLVSEFDPDAPIGAIQSNLVQPDIFNGHNSRDPVKFFKQCDGRFFDMKDVLYYVTINRGVPKAGRKARVATVLTSALADLNTSASDPDKRLYILNRGIIKWKLIAGTYFFKLWHPTAPKMVSELEIRHKLYCNGQYVQLLRRILDEQKEFNKMESKNYQYKTKLNRNGDDRMVNRDDEKNEIEEKSDRLRQEKEMIKMEQRAKKRLNRNVTYDKMKRNQKKLVYHECDTTIDVVSRLNRSIYHGFRGEWKKANSALDSDKRVDIYSNGNLDKARSKFPSERRDNYQFCQDV